MQEILILSSLELNMNPGNKKMKQVALFKNLIYEFEAFWCHQIFIKNEKGFTFFLTQALEK